MALTAWRLADNAFIVLALIWGIVMLVLLA